MQSPPQLRVVEFVSTGVFSRGVLFWITSSSSIIIIELEEVIQNSTPLEKTPVDTNSTTLNCGGDCILPPDFNKTLDNGTVQHYNNGPENEEKNITGLVDSTKKQNKTERVNQDSE